MSWTTFYLSLFGFIGFLIVWHFGYTRAHEIKESLKQVVLFCLCIAFLVPILFLITSVFPVEEEEYT